MRFRQRWIFSLLLLCTAPAWAELQIEINQGVENPTPIAVVPFAWQGVGSAPEDVAQIVDSDLARSGQFSPVSRRDMLSYPTRESELFFPRLAGNFGRICTDWTRERGLPGTHRLSAV